MSETQVKASIPSVGINQDADPTALKPGEYIEMLNGTTSDKGGVGNAEGSVPSAMLPDGYMEVGQRRINNNGTVLMLANPAGGSEIGIFSNGIYATKVNYPGLNFDIRYPIQVKHKVNYRGEVIIYWTAANNPPMWMNIDKPTYIKVLGPDGCSLIDGPDLDLDFMKIFKDYSRPCIKVASVTDTGRIPSCGLFITGQYADGNSNGITAWFPLTGPIPIYKDSLSQAHESIGGIASEEPTTKAVLLKISGADRSFTHINIGVIRVTNGVIRPFKVATVSTGITEYLYTGAGNTEVPVTLEEITEPPVNYNRAKTVEVTSSQLLLGNLKSEQDFNFQPYISKLQVQWQIYKAESTDTKNSFKNPLFSAYMKVFRQDEVYALGLVLDFIDGTTSKGYHIPGRRKNLKSDGSAFADANDSFGQPINGAQWDSQPPTNTDDILDSSETERHQVYNTATVEGSLSTGSLTGIAEYGEMGYWESTEKYECNTDVYGDDAGQPIRHHRLPDSRIFHIHDGLDGGRAYNDKVVYNYLGVRLPNINEVIASLPANVRAKIKGWRLVVGDRTYNKSVIASGIIFNARVQNWRYGSDFKDDIRLFPNYPLNDLRPDPYIATGPGIVNNDFNAFIGNPVPIGGDFGIMHNAYKKDVFFFHSPDTHLKKSLLSNGELIINAELYGKTDSYYEFVEPYPEFKEKDNDMDRAALQGVSIGTYNNYTLPGANQTRRKVSDAFYVPFNAKVNGGATGLPIHNVFRESSVAIALTKPINNPTHRDNSRFILNDRDSRSYGLEIDQAMGCTIRNRTRNCSAYYVTIKNKLPNQYGSIHDIRYNDSYPCTGLDGIPDGVYFAGDTFIGPFSFKTQHVFYQNVEQFMSDGPGMDGVEFKPAETIAHTYYHYKNRGSSENPRNQSNMMCEDNQGHGIFGIGGDGNATGLGWLALMMYGIPNFFAESDYNLELRYPGETPQETFYKHLNHGSYRVNEWLGIKTIRFDNFFYANEDYSFKNNIKLIEPPSPLYDPNIQEPNHYNTRVIRSLKSQPEDIQDNWIRFRPLDYYDLSKTRGELMDIRYLGNYKTIFRMQMGLLMDTIYTKIDTSEGQAMLGGGNMFEKEPTEVLSTDGGYAGTCSQFAFNATEAGAFLTSADTGKVFLLSGNVQDITSGLSDWFQQNLPFVLSEQIKGLPKDNACNPEGIGLISGWDPQTEMWFLTKRDYSIIDAANIPKMEYRNGQIYLNGNAVSLDNKTIFRNISWTRSYSPADQHWIALHSFIPNYYISQFLAFYSGQNRGYQIWKHNTPGTYHSYYGRKYPFFIESAEKVDGVSTYVNPSISFISRIINSDDSSSMVTFNKAILSNLYECSGLLNLVLQDENDLSQLFAQLGNTDQSRDVALRYREGHFNFSDFYNIFKGGIKHFFTSDWNNAEFRDSYPIDKVLDHSTLDYNKQEGDYGLLRERWIKYRLILDNRHDLKLLLQFVLIAERQSIS